ncbi:aminoglycoside phosphotransferase family protein [Kineococcus sp. DHX-1]|uniref:aminoglycoside phosphotransferase family protein n=1 Tax=Kineococcus sp. DHX-1 TaxID=3349638 RepID=UPI0036D2DFE9
MPLHEDEVPVDEHLVRALVRSQRPDLAGLPILDAGGGTDNTMFRLGQAHVARFPRTPEKVVPLRKELTWLPRLGPHLPQPVPTPVHAGQPDTDYPFPWAVFEWIPGDDAGAGQITDWACYGRDMARFVTALHSTDLMGATRRGDLDWYRGGRVQQLEDRVAACFTEVRARSRVDPHLDLDVDRLERLWSAALELPDPVAPHVWLHGDLRPANVLTRNGQLCAVLDFGALSVGWPDVEHVVAWDMPAAGRTTYRQVLGVDALTWARARAWAIALSVGGVCDYWTRLPSLAQESLLRLREIISDSE